MTKRHLLDPEADPVQRQLQQSICGMVAVDVTEDASAVTCKLCARIISDRLHARDRVRIGWDEALRDLAHLLGGPPIEPYPDLTPEGWSSMRCRFAAGAEEEPLRPVRCRCEWCQVDERNAQAKAKWARDQQIRPHRHYEHAFGSVNAALELLLRWRRDGAPARSSHGSMQARCMEVSRLGTEVQVMRHGPREDLTTRRATQAIDVERACEYAFNEESARRGLTRETCVGVLLASVDSDGFDAAQWAEALGVTESVIRGVVKHGRRQVTVRLAASGYIPEPRERVGLSEAIRKQREAVA